MSSAIFFASAAVLARPNFGVGTPASWEKLSWRRWPTFKRLMETSNQRYMAENSFWLKWTTFKRLMETCSCTDSCLCCWTPDTTAGRTCHTKFDLCLFWNHVEDKQGLHYRMRITFFGDPSTETPFTLCSKEAILAVSETEGPPIFCLLRSIYQRYSS